jgi:hypothetical protein
MDSIERTQKIILDRLPIVMLVPVMYEAPTSFNGLALGSVILHGDDQAKAFSKLTLEKKWDYINAIDKADNILKGESNEH